jgi:hypothetical protein
MASCASWAGERIPRKTGGFFLYFFSKNVLTNVYIYGNIETDQERRAKQMARTIMNGKDHKWEVIGNMVQLFERCGNRWVALGDAERWSDELISELIK